MVLGLIPAGAGQTKRASPPQSHRRAHPRRCGADRLFVPGNTVTVGSSPQVRGRHSAHQTAARGSGLIPAGAGQTNPPGRSSSTTWAHPRRCGADTSSTRVSPVSVGSSPQVRGRRAGYHAGGAGGGLIPAGAGQTVTVDGRVVAERAHPRRCGADFGGNDRYLGDRGSSPQVRGRHDRRLRPDP